MVKRAGAPVLVGDSVSLEDQIRCVERELRFRRKVYPSLVARGKMRETDAARETWVMQAVLDTLREKAGAPTAIQPDLLA